MKFYYEADGKKIYLTLKRGMPEWCNYDCPDIHAEKDESKRRWDGWLVLSYPLVLEDGNEDLFLLVKSFVKKSSEAFYKKYDHLWEGKNGFFENFMSQTAKYHPSLLVREESSHD